MEEALLCIASGQYCLHICLVFMNMKKAFCLLESVERCGRQIVIVVAEELFCCRYNVSCDGQVMFAYAVFFSCISVSNPAR